jgi:hypothetical protein
VEACSKVCILDINKQPGKQYTLIINCAKCPEKENSDTKEY